MSLSALIVYAVKLRCRPNNAGPKICLFVIYKAEGKPQSQRKTTITYEGNGLGAAETLCAYACRIQKHTRSDVNSFRLLDHASIFIELQYMCIAFLLIMHNPLNNLTRKRKCRRFCTNFCGNLEHVNFRWWQNQITTVFCCSYSALQWGPFLSNPSSLLYHLLMHSSPLYWWENGNLQTNLALLKTHLSQVL